MTIKFSERQFYDSHRHVLLFLQAQAQSDFPFPAEGLLLNWVVRAATFLASLDDALIDIKIILRSYY